MPALAFGSHYSVFKERPGTHLFTGVDAGCPKDCSGRKALAGESPSVAGGPGGPFRRVCHIIRHASERQRVRTGRIPADQHAWVGLRGQFYRSSRFEPRTPRPHRVRVMGHTDWWHAKNQTPALRKPPRCSGPNWLSVPLALRSGSPYEDVRCPLTSSTYRVSQTCVTRSSPPVVARP